MTPMLQTLDGRADPARDERRLKWGVCVWELSLALGID